MLELYLFSVVFFWQKEKGEFKERSNFFTQAERNAQKIIDLLNKRGIFDVLVTSTCVFPESIIEYRSDVTRPFWSIASKNAGRGLSDFIEDELGGGTITYGSSNAGSGSITQHNSSGTFDTSFSGTLTFVAAGKLTAIGNGEWIAKTAAGM